MLMDSVSHVLGKHTCHVMGDVFAAYRFLFWQLISKTRNFAKHFAFFPQGTTTLINNKNVNDSYVVTSKARRLFHLR